MCSQSPASRSSFREGNFAMHRLPFSSNTPALGLAPPNEVPGWMSCAIHFFQANIISFRSFYFLTGMPPTNSALPSQLKSAKINSRSISILFQMLVDDSSVLYPAMPFRVCHPLPGARCHHPAEEHRVHEGKFRWKPLVIPFLTTIPYQDFQLFNHLTLGFLRSIPTAQRFFLTLLYSYHYSSIFSSNYNCKDTSRQNLYSKFIYLHFLNLAIKIRRFERLEIPVFCSLLRIRPIVDNYRFSSTPPSSHEITSI